jgi:hypothetical protein
MKRIGCTCPVPFTEDDYACTACEQAQIALYEIQAPATCACCGVSSTEGSASYCWECEDEAVEGRDEGCSVRARFERRMERLYGAA